MGERDPARRFRGRLPAPVTIWTCTHEDWPVGLTVSSVLVADGAPARLLGLIDPDSDLADALAESDLLAVSLLTWRHHQLADAFAGLAPAPGGVFQQATWTTTAWGPVLADAPGWAGARLEREQLRTVGWGLQVQAVIEHVELVEEDEPVLMHRRGRYHQA